MSKVGTWLCGAYLVLILLCAGIAFAPSSDSKGRFVLLQLPIAVQGSLLQELGFGESLARLSWFSAYLMLATPTLGVLYLAGWLVDRKR